jgi:tRNA A37 threonylcarbamoyladenosine synthetase subunit TsaC/SUA5/YrdC
MTQKDKKKGAVDLLPFQTDTAYHIQARLDDGGAMLQLVNTKTRAVLSPTFQITKKKLEALREIARVVEE